MGALCLEYVSKRTSDDPRPFNDQDNAAME
jgi:hypothetical protein